jgi:hypothetical protein
MTAPDNPLVERLRAILEHCPECRSMERELCGLLAEAIIEEHRLWCPFTSRQFTSRQVCLRPAEIRASFGVEPEEKAHE